MKRMPARDRSGERGIAMVTAMAAAVIISILAVVVLNMTFRRFELSAFRTDRAVAGAAAEAGLKYAFARLQLDTTYTDLNFPGPPGFANVVQRAGQAVPPRDYVLRCHPLTGLAVDQVVPQLHVGAKINTERNPNGTPGPNYGQYVGGKHVTVRIRWDPAGTGGAARPYIIRASADYGTGN